VSGVSALGLDKCTRGMSALHVTLDLATHSHHCLHSRCFALSHIYHRVLEMSSVDISETHKNPVSDPEPCMQHLEKPGNMIMT
jgi:hypothetical protein